MTNDHTTRDPRARGRRGPRACPAARFILRGALADRRRSTAPAVGPFVAPRVRAGDRRRRRHPQLRAHARVPRGRRSTSASAKGRKLSGETEAASPREIARQRDRARRRAHRRRSRRSAASRSQAPKVGFGACSRASSGFLKLAQTLEDTGRQRLQRRRAGDQVERRARGRPARSSRSRPATRRSIRLMRRQTPAPAAFDPALDQHRCWMAVDAVRPRVGARTPAPGGGCAPPASRRRVPAGGRSRPCAARSSPSSPPACSSSSRPPPPPGRRRRAEAADRRRHRRRRGDRRPARDAGRHRHAPPRRQRDRRRGRGGRRPRRRRAVLVRHRRRRLHDDLLRPRRQGPHDRLARDGPGGDDAERHGDELRGAHRLRAPARERHERRRPRDAARVGDGAARVRHDLAARRAEARRSSVAKRGFVVDPTFFAQTDAAKAIFADFPRPRRSTSTPTARRATSARSSATPTSRARTS